jgi:hypothetical protein
MFLMLFFFLSLNKVKFNSDTIDETNIVEETLKPRVESFGGTVEKVELSGNHITPCIQVKLLRTILLIKALRFIVISFKFCVASFSRFRNQDGKLESCILQQMLLLKGLNHFL